MRKKVFEDFRQIDEVRLDWKDSADQRLDLEEIRVVCSKIEEVLKGGILRNWIFGGKCT